MQSLSTSTNNGMQNTLPDLDSLSMTREVGSSSAHQIESANITPYFQGLQGDVEQFVQQALTDRSVNIITSPLLVKTTEQITARVMLQFQTPANTLRKISPVVLSKIEIYVIVNRPIRNNIWHSQISRVLN